MMISARTILVIFLILGQAWTQDWSTPTEVPFGVGADDFAVTYANSCSCYNAIWTSGGKLYQTSDYTDWAWRQVNSDKNLSRPFVQGMYYRVFQGARVLTLLRGIVIGNFTAETASMAVESDSRMQLVWTSNNQTWSNIFNYPNWSTPELLNTTGDSYELTSLGNNNWMLSYINNDTRYYMRLDNGTWSSPIDAGNANSTQFIQYNGYYIRLTDQLYYSKNVTGPWENSTIPDTNCSVVPVGSTRLSLFCRNITHFKLYNFLPLENPVPNFTFIQDVLVVSPTVYENTVNLNGTMVVSSSVHIKGDLVMSSDAVLEINTTQRMDVQGQAVFSGKLKVQSGVVGLIMTYNSTNTTFNSVEIDECYKVRYLASELIVVASCATPFELWKIILICAIAVSITAAAIVLMVVFRKKIFPHRDKTFFKPTPSDK